jgi:hypothetical protein
MVRLPTIDFLDDGAMAVGSISLVREVIWTLIFDLTEIPEEH